MTQSASSVPKDTWLMRRAVDVPRRYRRALMVVSRPWETRVRGHPRTLGAPGGRFDSQRAIHTTIPWAKVTTTCFGRSRSGFGSEHASVLWLKIGPSVWC